MDDFQKASTLVEEYVTELRKTQRYLTGLLVLLAPLTLCAIYVVLRLL